MSETRDQRLVRLFEASTEMSGDERTAFFERECADDPDLLRDLIELLEYSGTRSGLLEPPRIVGRGGARDHRPSSDPLECPANVGPYRIEGIIAEGGMGTVYLAEQEEPIRRQVALKLVKFGMDTRRVIARFEMERQTLALMDHPHIARVFDAGTTAEGRPYFVMEYFPGHSMTRFADEERLSVDDRLRLFLQACEAVQSAHQKGVIHRDLKPSNLLVRRIEGRPFLKVIDFGIAKVIQEDVPDHTRFTAYGEIIGTPEYMSPEQASLAPGGIDTTTDVYSLGVLLYQLLTGTLPTDHSATGESGARPARRFTFDADPPRPSDRLIREQPGQEEAARARRTSPTHLRRVLRQDLDWIVLKSIERDRSRRYQSVADMAEDIQRYLEGSTVSAAAPTATYRLRKLVRRHRALVMGTGAVLVTLLAGSVTATWFAIKADRERALQIEATERATVKAREAEASAYAANLKAAEAALMEGNMLSVEEHLAQAPEFLRGWEWHHLHGLTNQSLLTLIPPDGFEMRYQRGIMAVMPDSGHVAVLAHRGGTGAYFEWDVGSGRLVARREFAADSMAACMSSNGAWLVRLVGDSCVVERARSGEQAHSVPSDAIGPNLLLRDLSDSGRFLVTMVQDTCQNLVYDFDAGESWCGGRWSAWPTFYEPEGRLIAARGSQIQLRNLATGTQEMTLDNGRPDTDTMDCLWIRERGHVLTAAMDGHVRRLFTGGGGSGWRDVPVSRAPFWDMALGPGGRDIVVGGRDRRLWVLDEKTGTVKASFSGHHADITEILSFPDRPLAVSRSTEEILIWDLNHDPEKHDVLTGHESYVYPVAFDERGTTVVSGGWDGRIVLWDHSRRKAAEIKELRPAGGEAFVRDLVRLPRGNRFLASVDTKRRVLVLWDVDSGVVTSAIPPDHTYQHLAADPVRPRVAGVWCEFGPSPGLVVWDSETLEVVHESDFALTPLAYGGCLAYAPDGRELAAGLPDPGLRILDPESFAVTRVVDTGTRNIVSLAYSPDGHRLAVGRDDFSVLVFDTDSWEPAGTLLGHTGIVHDLIWSPDGSRIFSAGDDGLIRVWDSETLHQLLALRGHEGYVYSLDMSPDGTMLASGSGDGTVRLWRTVD